MAQKHDILYTEKPMTVGTHEQGPQKRYRRLRFPSFDSVVWAEKNPLLQKGELGHEKDTGRFKVGDGVTYWLDLPYNSVGEQGDVGPQGEKGDPAKINGYNTITIQNGNNIDLQQEEDVLTISTKNIYNQTEIDDKVTVINTAIDANADAIQKTREDFIEADSEIHQILNAHASELTTQRNDIDGLGDQVSAIEEKIPETASAENPLVTRSEISSVYKFKGSVATYNDLPTGATVGDVYNVTDTGANYAWDGSAWDKLSETVDLSSYATTAYVNAREQDIRDDYMAADADLQTQINGQATAIAGNTEDITEINGKISSSASSTNKLISASELTAESQDIRSDYMAADSELQTQINGLSSAVAANQSNISVLRTDVDDLENQVTSNHNDITAHIADTSNPHNVTKTQVGLGNVDNTSDANKPVSTAQQTALNLKADKSTTYSKNEVDDLLAPKLDSETAEDTYATITNLNAHTSNTSNPHSVTKSQVGLGNVDNTSDLNKPVSTAQQAAINTAKQDVVSGYTTADGELQQQINGQATAISTNTSNITALTTRVGTNETNIALLDSDVGTINTDLATAKTDITNLKSSVNSQAGLIQGLQDDVSGKVDKNQGTANAGKILSVGSDGQVTVTSAPGGGLTAVAHDSTLTGAGTDASPLGIASTVLAEIADKAEQTTVETLSGAVSQNTTNIGTLRTDVDDLGDQVSGIEGKIPESTSATNQLVNATQLATKADTTYVDEQLAQKQDKATAVNYDNITNCITEIPQDIKLELNNGTLTLKAGSKVYVPNGAGVFNEITLTADKTAAQTVNDTRMYFYNGSYIEKVPIAQCFSGSSAPSGYTYMFWYDTTNNVVKKTSNSGSTWESGWSFPFCIATASGGALTSIDQVFNGFGYIGSCVFTLPGVKGLYPNGRNEDGTLKNVLINCTDVQVSSNFNDTIEHTLMINPNGRCAWYSTTEWYYNDIANVMVASTGTVLKSATLGTFKTTNGVVSNLNPYEVFHAVDYSEYKNTIDWVRTQTSNVVRLVAEQKATSANNYTWYRKYSDGWLEQGGIITTTGTITLPAAFSNDKYTVVCGGEYSFNGDNSVLEITATTIKFQHAINKPHRYYACGYAAS